MGGNTVLPVSGGCRYFVSVIGKRCREGNRMVCLYNNVFYDGCFCLAFHHFMFILATAIIIFLLHAAMATGMVIAFFYQAHANEFVHAVMHMHRHARAGSKVQDG